MSLSACYVPATLTLETSSATRFKEFLKMQCHHAMSCIAVTRDSNMACTLKFFLANTKEIHLCLSRTSTRNLDRCKLSGSSG